MVVPNLQTNSDPRVLFGLAAEAKERHGESKWVFRMSGRQVQGHDSTAPGRGVYQLEPKVILEIRLSDTAPMDDSERPAESASGRAGRETRPGPDEWCVLAQLHHERNLSGCAILACTVI